MCRINYESIYLYEKRIFLLGVLVYLATSVSAQEQEVFQPSGKVFMKVFSNFNTTTSDGISASEFALERVYFGYEYSMSKEFSGKLNIDIGDPGFGKLQMTAYIKNAYLQYKKGNLAIQFGLIGTTAFKEMESLWGNRYIEKSFQDAYKFNPSADLGVSINYSFTNWLAADFIFANGEGYKSLQADNLFKTGFGITLNPVESLTIRGYYDLMGDSTTLSTISGAIGYSSKKLTVAAEYNIQQNAEYSDGSDMSGASVYANFKAAKKLKVFARYDLLASTTLAGETESWNFSKDGNLILAGLEYAPVKGVKFAPNFRLWTPADESKANTTSFFLNCEIKF